MSSPVPLSVQQSPRRSIAGAVVLILLGVVLLLSTTGVLHGFALWRFYGRFWPALIILWGVIKLIEHQRAQAQGVRSSGIGAGGVVLLIFLIFTGLAATSTSRLDWQGMRDEFGWDDGDMADWFGESYSFNDETTQAFPPGGSLHVVSDHGSVNIQTADGNDIKVVIEKKVHAGSQAEADKYNLSTKPTIAVSDKVVNLNANTQGAGEHGVSTDMTISIPRKASVTISTHHGDVTVNSRDGDLDITCQHGDVAIEDVTGNASLNLQHSSLKISSVNGDVSVEGRVNDVTIADVKGAARLNGEFMESVKLSRIGKTVTFKSSRTDLEFAKLEGTLDLDSGNLNADSFSGPSRLITRSKDVRLEKVSGDLRIEDNNGAVQVQVIKVGNLQIDNRNGDIQLALPAKGGFHLDARARGGEIQSEFDAIKINDEHNMATASGAVGSPAANVRVNNEHGTIEISKGTVEESTPAVPPMPPASKTPKSSHPKPAPEPTEN